MVTYQSLNALSYGVLDDTQLITYSYQTQQTAAHNRTALELLNLDALLDVAHAYTLDTIWITPGSTFSHLARELITHEVEGLEMRVSKRRDGTPRFLLMWYRGFKSVKVGFPEHDDRWPWQACTDSDVLARSIHYLQEAINMEIAWSPGHVGQELMLAHNRNHETWLQPAHLPAEVKKHLARDMQWKRPLTREEKRVPMWFHLFDKNSQYLAACTSTLLGEGSPEHLIEDKIDGITFKAYIPGLWNVEGMGWLWTPELEYRFATLESMGALRPIIHEAYVWPKYHQALRSWGEDLWMARFKLNPGYGTQEGESRDILARTLAYKALKPIYTQGMGWLAHESKEGDNKLYRPDWWSMIVSTAHRNMGFKMRKLAHNDMPPVYCNVDAVGLISDSESIVPYLPVILDRLGQLGGFKHVGSFIITPDIAATFEDDARFSQCHDAVMTALEG